MKQNALRSLALTERVRFCLPACLRQISLMCSSRDMGAALLLQIHMTTMHSQTLLVPFRITCWVVCQSPMHQRCCSVLSLWACTLGVWTPNPFIRRPAARWCPMSAHEVGYFLYTAHWRVQCKLSIVHDGTYCIIALYDVSWSC